MNKLLMALALTALAVAPVRAEILTFDFALTGSQEVPPVDTPGSGAAHVTLDTDTNLLTWNVTYHDLKAAPSAAHFHGPAAAGVNGPVIINIGTGGLASPLNGSATITNTQKQQILDELWYVNVHTAPHPGGEIRGQVVHDPPAGDVVVYEFALEGSQEVPPVDTPGSGFAHVELNTATNQLTWNVTFHDLKAAASAAHFHGPAAPGVNGPVIVNIGLGGLTSPLAGTTTVSNAHEQQILDGLWYVNVHTAPHPGGEIRGQVVDDPPVGDVLVYDFPLEGAQEVPPVDTPGSGVAHVELNTATNQLTWNVSFQDLKAPASAAHFHGPAAPGVNGPVIVNIGLSGLASPLIGTATVSNAHEQQIIDGLWYVNVHTSVHPGGEIRGQVVNPEPPPTPVLVSSLPASGSIDPAQPSAPDGSNIAGWDQVELTFDGPVELAPEDFETSEEGGDGIAPTVISVAAVHANVVLLTLSEPIEPQAWTDITVIDSGDNVRLGFLPADVNADETSAASDVLALIDALNGVTILPLFRTDIDRSGQAGAPDVLRTIDLLNGAAAYDVWNFASLP